MARIDRFEDLQIWQEARALDKEVFRVSLKCQERKDFELGKVLQKTSGSVMDNIAEGFEREGTKEYKQFLYIAKASLAELRSQLYRATDREYLGESQRIEIDLHAIKLKKKIAALINYLNQSEFKGSKYSEPEVEYNSDEFNRQINGSTV